MNKEQDSEQLHEEETQSASEQDAELETPVEGELLSEEQSELDSNEDDAEVEQESEDDKVAALNDQLLRVQAEMQNVRRRSDSDVEKARKFALERFAKELLPVADNLERTIAAANATDNDEVKPLLEGVELTLKSFQDCIAKFNLEAVNPVGEPFDPQMHEAISMVPAPDAEPNSVIDVVQKGYTLNGRVIRAAMVVVATKT